MHKLNSTSLHPKMEETSICEPSPKPILEQLSDLDVKPKPKLKESLYQSGNNYLDLKETSSEATVNHDHTEQKTKAERFEGRNNHLGAQKLLEEEDLSTFGHAAGVDHEQYLRKPRGVHTETNHYGVNKETEELKEDELCFAGRKKKSKKAGSKGLEQDNSFINVQNKPPEQQDEDVGLSTQTQQYKAIRMGIKELKQLKTPEGVSAEAHRTLSDGLEKFCYFFTKLETESDKESFGKLCQSGGIVNMRVMREFCDLLNKDCSDCITSVDVEDLIKRFKHCPEELPNFVNLILLVGQKSGKVVISKVTPPGCHWVFVHIDMNENIVYYSDSLGHAAPHNICHYLRDLTLMKSTKDIKTIMMHSPSPWDTRHSCDDSCKNYCLQKCNFVCGFVVICYSALAALDRAFFLKVFVEDKAKTFHHDPTRYEGYLRQVVCTWFATNEVDISLLKLEDAAVENKTPK